MNHYAVIQKPGKSFKYIEIHFIFQTSYLKAIEEFERSEYYNSKNIYTIYNVEEVDNHCTLNEITTF